ncbi:MAG: disulfide bond formation protein B [Pseudomonadales bacterium]|nr:disulfide bond formation protein B [Pseudomonadales bacterium]
MTIPSSRIIFALIFLGCAGAIAAALYMEHVMGLEPCPLCIFQRVFVIAGGVIALAGALHNPRLNGIKVYGGLVVSAAVIGGGLAIRQLYLQHLPKDQVPACGPSLDYLLDVFPLTEVLKMVLSGDGSCAEVQWTFAGLSIPGWTLIGFIGLAAIGVFQMLNPKR